MEINDALVIQKLDEERDRVRGTKEGADLSSHMQNYTNEIVNSISADERFKDTDVRAEVFSIMKEEQARRSTPEEPKEEDHLAQQMKAGEESQGLTDVSGDIRRSEQATRPEVQSMDLSEIIATTRALKRKSLHMGSSFITSRAESERNELNELGPFISQIATANGIPLEYKDGQLGNTLEDGTFMAQDSEILDELFTNKYEAIMGTAGGMAGAAVGFARTPGPWPAKVVDAAIGAAGVTLGTAPIGRGADIQAAAEALGMVDQLEAREVWGQMKQSGVDMAERELVLGPLSSVVINGVGAAWRAVRNRDGVGARRALEEITGLARDQIDQIVNIVDSSTSTPTHTSRLSREIEAVGLTQPGAEAFMEPAMGLDPVAGTRVVREISTRATDLLSSTKRLVPDKIVTVVQDELGTYQREVKKLFTTTRQKAIDEVPKAYRFDYDSLAISPLLDAMESKITNPSVLEAFKLQVAKARLIGTSAVKKVQKQTGEMIETPVRPTPQDATGQRIFPEGTTIELAEDLRSFENLLELRQVVNNFKFNKKISSAVDKKGINAVLKKIDKEVSKTVDANVTNAAAWKQRWKRSNTEYAKMKMLEENVIFKALSTKGAEPAKLVRLFANKISSPDGTFMQLVSKLPASTRTNMEGAVLDHLANKFTAGVVGDNRATHFPMLAKELEGIAFSTGPAQNLKRVIKGMSEVWKNDVNLAKASGHISIPRFQSFLTADPVMRAKYEFASSMFNYIKRLAPGQKGRNLSLVTKAGKVLENPLSSKSIDELMQGMGRDPKMADAVNRMAIEFAKSGQKDLARPKITIYRAASEATKNAKSQGAIGKGVYYFDKMSKASARAKGRDGVKVYKETVHPHRIADQAAIKTLIGVDEITPQILREKSTD